MSKQEQQKHADLETIEEQVFSSTEQFIEKNKKAIIYTVAVAVVVVLAVLSFRNFYLVPQEKLAADEMYKAQTYFAVDSFQLALNGDDVECNGFQSIIEDYSLTESANLASAYAGICAYKLGDFESAAGYLNSYDGADDNLAVVIAQLLGDTYVELGELSKAIASYKDVIAAENTIFSPMSLKKAGIVYEKLEKNDDALKMYNQIKEDYSRSAEAADIDKYIAVLEALN